jgi:hypothetical protein
MDNFDLKKYLAEGKLFKENLNLSIDDDMVELSEIQVIMMHS